MYPLKPTRSILHDSFPFYQGNFIHSMKSMTPYLLREVPHFFFFFFKIDNKPFVFLCCVSFFLSGLCLIKRHGRPRNVENQPAVLSPQSYVFTLSWEWRDFTKFDCQNINLQNWRQMTMIFILHNVISQFPQLYPVSLNIHEL